jgi:hypothetical protein
MQFQHVRATYTQREFFRAAGALHVKNNLLARALQTPCDTYLELLGNRRAAGAILGLCQSPAYADRAHGNAGIARQPRPQWLTPGSNVSDCTPRVPEYPGLHQ